MDEAAKQARQISKFVKENDTTSLRQLLEGIRAKPPKQDEFLTLEPSIRSLRRHSDQTIVKLAEALLKKHSSEPASKSAPSKASPSPPPAKSAASPAKTAAASKKAAASDELPKARQYIRDQLEGIFRMSIETAQSDERKELSSLSNSGELQLKTEEFLPLPGDPKQLAVDLEVVLHSMHKDEIEYKRHFQTLSFNLKKNGTLCELVCFGLKTAEELARMKPEDMATEAVKKMRADAIKATLLDAQLAQPMVSESGMFTCSRCGQSKTTFYQMQTRSADEPMTVFITCVNCGKKWRL